MGWKNETVSLVILERENSKDEPPCGGKDELGCSSEHHCAKFSFCDSSRLSLVRIPLRLFGAWAQVEVYARRAVESGPLSRNAGSVRGKAFFLKIQALER